MTALVSIGPGSTVQWPVVEVFLKQEGIPASALAFFSSNGDDLGIASGATSGLATCSASNQNREAFADFARCLAPGARLYVYDALRDAARQGTVQKDLLLSGFADTKIDTYSGIVLVQATKPNYDIGAKSLLRKPAAAAGAAQPAAAAAKTWGISADDNDDELMDEDELLTAEDKQPVLAANDDCDVGKAGKKACKNCTCGRAEQESTGVKLTAEMLENPTSACGNCNLGDAFRCSSCPYRGLPAFESGKKIQLGSDLLTADI